MACKKSYQLYDGSKSSSSNTNTLYASSDLDSVTVLSASGLEEGNSIPVLVSDTQTGPFTQYVVDGQNVVITYDNPVITVESGKWYKLDTSSISSNTDAKVESTTTQNEIATSVKAWFKPNGSSEYIEVEIIRLKDGEVKKIFNLGTNKEIINPVGEFYFERATERLDYISAEQALFQPKITQTEDEITTVIQNTISSYTISSLGAKGQITVQNTSDTYKLYVKYASGINKVLLPYQNIDLPVEPNDTIVLTYDSSIEGTTNTQTAVVWKYKWTTQYGDF